MVKFFRVKEKARGLARQQKYDQALAEYRAAITQAEAQGDTAALRNLYNAAGDAFLQKSDSATALEYFDKAADLYLEEGLHDNAIALCHKILRNVPTKADVYGKLGRIYAEKGLRNESIQNWLEYAGRREKASDLAAVARAFREVVQLSPESHAVRQQLAEILLAQGEVQEALGQLEQLRLLAEEAGDAGRAEELRERVANVRREHGTELETEFQDPLEGVGTGGEPAAAEPRPSAGRPTSEPIKSAGGQHPEGRPHASAELAREEGEPGASPGMDAGFGFSDQPRPMSPPAAETSIAPPGEAPSIAPPGKAPFLAPPGETDASSLIPPGETGTASLPSPGESGTPSLASPFELEALPPVGTLPGFTPSERSGPASLDVEAPPFVPVEERITRAEARLAEDPGNAEERVYLGEIYQEAGALDLARAAMGQGASELFAAGQHEKAYRAYRSLAALVPSEIELAHKLVEVARATGCREHLLESHEVLAARFMEVGDYLRAGGVHRRILEIDPEHRQSHDQLLIMDGLEGGRAHGLDSGERPPGSSSNGDYIDLAKLIAEGEPVRSPAPRMMAEASPTGDEEADLQAVIDTFRQGVAVNIDQGDFQSHYDLGVAFRQMGLLDEALREFQLAARGAEHRGRAFEFMGLCFMEKGMASVAVNCFRQGIEGERNPHEALGLRYHLARSLEELGDPAGARGEYEKVIALDLQFMDAAERLKVLT